MPAWVEIPPLEQRAAECPCCMAVIDTIAGLHVKQLKARSSHQISERLADDFNGQWVRRSLITLSNLGQVTVSFDEEYGKINNPTLTDAGWDASTIDRPFWMVAHE